MSTFLIASLKHTNKADEFITFWRPLHRGYTPVIERAGRYCYGEAVELNDGDSYIAVPPNVVELLQLPTPYYKPGAKFFDHAGPVVANTRAAWNALIAGSLAHGRTYNPKPEPFRGKRRAIYTE